MLSGERKVEELQGSREEYRLNTLKDQVEWWRCCQRMHGKDMHKAPLCELISDASKIKKYLRFTIPIHARFYMFTLQVTQMIRKHQFEPAVAQAVPWL